MPNIRAGQKWPTLVLVLRINQYLFIFVHRKVVWIRMAIQTTGEPAVQTFTVRFAMTILATGNLSVRGMACCALQ